MHSQDKHYAGPAMLMLMQGPCSQVYKEEAQPVEDFFRRNNLLLDFEITGGIPETLPRLHSTLEPYVWALQKPRIAQAV